MSGKSTVLFKETKSRDLGTLKKALKALLKENPFFDGLRKSEIVPVKLTFGEKDNKGYPNPELIKVLVDKLKSKATKPYLTDSNVLYHGSRTNAVDHLNLAYEHGFTPQVCGAPLIIADGVFSENAKEVPVKGKHLSSVKIPATLLSIDSLVGVAHFTGHMLTGFGGAIKNIGMGLASRAGKQVQHSCIKPDILKEKCTLCRKCIEFCPVKAITEKDEKAFIDEAACIGCGDCIAACRFAAVNINWEADVRGIEERIVEYAWGILGLFKRKYFINLLYTVTVECDCMETGTEGIVEDIGILGSDDPVALDKACLDLVLERADKDVFKKVHPKADYKRKLEYACEIGLGNSEYELVVI